MKLRTAIANLSSILAIEALVAAAGLELRLDALRSSNPAIEPGERTHAVLNRIRAEVEPMRTDRFLAADIAIVRQLVETGELARAAGLAA